MTKHVVNIVPAFIPGDGIGNAARARVSGLLDRGYCVSVICATAKVADGEFPGLTLMQAGAGWEADRSSLTHEMYATLKTADVVFLEFGCFNICHELLNQVAAPLILFYQGITPALLMKDDMYNACYWRAIGELRKIPRPAMVLAASQFTLDEHRRNTGYEPSKSKVVPLFGNTCDTANPPIPIDRRPFKVLTVGQLFPHKNYEVLIEATKLLVRDRLDIEVHHIGGANDLIAMGYRNKLQSLASSLGGRFRFLGRVDQAVLDRAYADAHVVVIPSLHEGYSLPVREALVHGKPVIASSFGSLPETLQGVGRLFHPLDAVELARAIADYAEMDGPTWEMECSRAKQAAASHSVERYVQSCVDAIEDVLADRRTISVDAEYQLTLGQPKVQHEVLVGSAEYLSGRIRLRLDSEMQIETVAVQALIKAARQILRTDVQVGVRWQVEHGEAVCVYQLSLDGIEDCTSIYFSFVNARTGSRMWTLGGFEREHKPLKNDDKISQELHRLSLAIADNYSPKSIVASDRRWLTRLKTKVANTILKLVYQVFIGPQMATMQSQARLFALLIDQRRVEQSPETRITNCDQAGNATDNTVSSVAAGESP